MPGTAAPKPIIIMPDGDADSVRLLEAALTEVDASSLEIRSVIGVPQTDEQWIERIALADGILLGWGMPSAALTAAPKLRVISFLGTGVNDHVDLELARERGIVVTNVAGYGDDAVAEHALALLLASVRDIPRLDRSMRAGVWVPRSTWQLRGRRLGVVGLGGIGQRMAELGAAIGMEVVGWNRSAETGKTEHNGITLMPLEELMATSDAVSLHLPLTPGTTGLIDDRLLQRMKPDSVLVNTARGAVVDEAALLRVLNAGHIRAAALDVFHEEPLAADNPLRRHERTVLTPHVGFNTEDAARQLFVLAVENLVRHFAAVESVPG